MKEIMNEKQYNIYIYIYNLPIIYIPVLYFLLFIANIIYKFISSGSAHVCQIVNLLSIDHVDVKK